MAVGKKRVAILALVTVVSLCVGRMGTTFSRTDMTPGDGCFVGKWPYQAVANDVLFLVKPFCLNKYTQPLEGQFVMLGAGWGLISLPSDVWIDTILFPADIVAWLCGYQKKPIQRPWW